VICSCNPAPGTSTDSIAQNEGLGFRTKKGPESTVLRESPGPCSLQARLCRIKVEKPASLVLMRL
jgi:hypothetical protein